MNSFGLLKTNIVIDVSIIDIGDFLIDLRSLEKYRIGIFTNPYDYLNRIRCDNSLIDLFEKEEFVAFEHRVNKTNIFIYKCCQYIMIEYSSYSNIIEEETLKLFLKKYLKYSETVLIGFELDLFIDEYPKNIDGIINDKSIYPIYMYHSTKHMDAITYERLANTKELNEMDYLIRDFIGSL